MTQAEQAAALADALDRSAALLSTMARDAMAAANALVLAAEGIDTAETMARTLATALAKPAPPNGAWGPGPVSGHRWWSGVNHRGQPALDAFVKGPRCGVGVDLLHLFCPTSTGLCATWDMLAGGAGDSPETADGVLTFVKGMRQGHTLWTDPVSSKLPIAYTIRVVPDAASNRDGANPGVWEEIRTGQRDDVFRRLGTRLAFRDRRHARAAPLILEPAHEMSGAWYPHSIHGRLADGRFAWQVFPDAWDRIVDRIREGYTKEAGKQCPILFTFRPSRSALPGGIRMDRFLPPAGSFDLIGISAHDNYPWTTSEQPRLAWSPAANQAGQVETEGWLAVAELAAKYRRPMAFFEWGAHPPESTSFKSGPEAGLFARAFWDFCCAHTHLLAAETFYDTSETTFSSRPDWAPAVVYRRCWGRAAAAATA